MPLVNVTVGSFWLDFLKSQSSIHRQPKGKYSLRDEDNGQFIKKNMDSCIDTNLKKNYFKMWHMVQLPKLFPEEIRKICSPETTMPIA